jgi:hypothetical protein
MLAKMAFDWHLKEHIEPDFGCTGLQGQQVWQHQLKLGQEAM